MERYQYQSVPHRGHIEQLEYTFEAEGVSCHKYVNVYVPYGYDPSDATRRYDVLYMMHGGGGNPDAWLDSCCFKNMLDQRIDSGMVRPMLVVFPSFYTKERARVGVIVRQRENHSALTFVQELVQHVLPAVEARYHTFAADITPQGLMAARQHRGFGGFSMGAVTTWYVFLQANDYFSAYMPLSGDCWALQPMGGSGRTEETAALISQAAATHEAWHIYAATGEQDIAYPNLTPQIEAMKQNTDVFQFSEDPSQGNLCYLAAPDHAHDYVPVMDYVAYFLPYLFQ